MCGVISDILGLTPKQQKPQEVEFIAPEEVTSDVVDDIKSKADTDLDARLRRRRGKRALRSVGLAGIPTGNQTANGPTGIGGL